MSDETYVENLERIIKIEKESESVEPQKIKERVTVLFSGGADSVLLMKMVEQAGYKPFALMINYNQLHKEELDYATKYCTDNKIEYKILELKNYDVPSALTTGEKGLYKGVSVYNVPARNSIFLSLAAGISEANGSNKIFIGCDYSDREGLFFDCYQEYFIKLNQVFEIAFSYKIKVYPLLLGFTKEMVLSTLENQYGIKAENLYTGYREFA